MWLETRQKYHICRGFRPKKIENNNCHFQQKENGGLITWVSFLSWFASTVVMR